MKPTLLLLTCANQKEADMIAQRLLDKKLAACVKQLSIKSSSWWQGKRQNAKEVLLLIETMASKFTAIEKQVKQLHSYEQFVLQEIPVTKTSAGVVEWIKGSLQ